MNHLIKVHQQSSKQKECNVNYKGIEALKLLRKYTFDFFPMNFF